jgi:hypothetical protein
VKEPGCRMKRAVMAAVRSRKRTRSMRKTTLPMVVRPVKVKGCWERRTAREPVDTGS